MGIVYDYTVIHAFKGCRGEGGSVGHRLQVPQQLPRACLPFKSYLLKSIGYRPTDSAVRSAVTNLFGAAQ